MNAAARFLNQGSLSRSWIISLIISRTQYTLCILMMSILLSALGIVYTTNVTRDINANLQTIIAERTQLHLEWNQLLLEQGALSSPSRVQNYAEKKFDMIIPNGKKIVVIHE